MQKDLLRSTVSKSMSGQESVKSEDILPSHNIILQTDSRIVSLKNKASSE